jgi:hypothetical protein
MERFIIKDPQIFPLDNKKIGLLVLYTIDGVFFCLIRPYFKYFAQGLQKPWTPMSNPGRPWV